MSLLDSGARYDDIVVYPQELVTDIDGNSRTRPSTTGIPAKARFQEAAQSGTSARRAEQDVEGEESEQNYSMRVHPAYDQIIGPQAQIEWNGERWAVFGFAKRYNSSRRTAHFDYSVRRF